MKVAPLFLTVILIASVADAQKPAKAPTGRSSAKITKPAEKPAVRADDKADLEKALAAGSGTEKIAALEKFLREHPASDLRQRALESLAAARVLVGSQKLESGEREAAVAMLKTAAAEAPFPYSERLFAEAISKLPGILYFRGERSAAMEVAALIEKNALDKPAQLLSLAEFHLSIENGDQARRLAESALRLDEASVAAHLTLGLAHRLNFDLDASAAAYEKALALDPASAAARRSLADVKRANGKHEDAIALYKAALESDTADDGARNGLVLALFESGKRAEAEAELARALEADPNNIVLLGGVAYAHAAAGEGAKAIEYAQKAIAIEPRYIWPHIAVARGLLLDGKYSEAEQVLLRAREYGNFPTLEYEIASARLAGGFYREAAEELVKSFSVKDGKVTAKLGRRVERSADSFTELLATERRASTFISKAADHAENAAQLKVLLELYEASRAAVPVPEKLGELAAAFASGGDKMRFHRQLYAADLLLDRKVAVEKALELSKSAMASVDDGLSVPQPAGPVMATELYESRTSAMAAGRYVILPDVAKQTLSAIARGRIEDIAGRAFLEQNNFTEAAVRFRRALSVLPENSAWWRSVMWRLGTALEADKKDKDALDTYVKVYKSDSPNAVRYAAIESVYKKINGGIDGLDALIGPNPAAPPPPVVASSETDKKVDDTAASSVKADTDAGEKTASEKRSAEEKDAKATAEIKPANEKAADQKAEPSPDLKPPAAPEKPVENVEPVIEKKSGDAEKQPDTVETKKEKQSGKVEPSPEEKPVDAKTDDRAASSADIGPEKPGDADKKTPVEPAASDAKKPDSKKPLFEPVIIEIRTPKPKTPDASTPGEQKTEADPGKPPAGPVERPRVVEGKEVAADVPCTISVSQENVSLIGGGGSVGLLVGIDGEREAKQIKAESSSPSDIEVVLEPEIAGVPSRAFYIIRSLTTNAGVYQVRFTATCGQKEVVVRVR